MNASKQLAKHTREIFLGGNWTWSNFKDQLSDVTWEQANTKIESFNTITTLTFHCWYYIKTVTQVLEGGPLESKDELSFQHPEISTQQEWEGHLNQLWEDVERFAQRIESLPEEQLWKDFVAEKYGIYFRNLMGIIEHSHYHLGQIALLKKIILNNSKTEV